MNKPNYMGIVKIEKCWIESHYTYFVDNLFGSNMHQTLSLQSARQWVIDNASEIRKYYK